MSETATFPVEQILREELARGDVVISTAVPILRHLLANDDHSLFSDEIVAKVRGAVTDVARQMLFQLAAAADVDDRREFAAEWHGNLTNALLRIPALLGHAHALALEHQLTARLSQRNTVDPVLSPMLQELLASRDAPLATLAMEVLAAQSRFMQYVRRMELPLGELPADLFHDALTTFREVLGDERQEEAGVAEAALRNAYDESRCRTALMTRLLAGLGNGARQALSLSHGGLALFATALGMSSRQERDLIVFSLNERQLARFALSLRASGLKHEAVEEQFIYLYPDLVLPEGFERIRVDKAASMLGESSPQLAG